MKKYLAFLLCAAMLVSMLGCQVREPAPETTAAPETAAPTEPPKPSSESF